MVRAVGLRPKPRETPPLPTQAAVVARKHYSAREIYWITVKAAHTAWATRSIRCDSKAAERIMLAVTEVNGCAVCSYAHTRLALDMGFTQDEVRALLTGITDDVPDDELAGLAYAQHYADTRGIPDPEAWSHLVDRYGLERALCVLRATQIMMWGNATGIPLSALLTRIRGMPDPLSSLRYEVVTSLAAAALVPIALVHAVVLASVRLPTDPSTARTPSRGHLPPNRWSHELS